MVGSAGGLSFTRLMWMSFSSRSGSSQLTVSPFPTFENLALIKKPISWTTEPSPIVSPSVVLWRSFRTERSAGRQAPPSPQHLGGRLESFEGKLRRQGRRTTGAELVLGAVLFALRLSARCSRPVADITFVPPSRTSH